MSWRAYQYSIYIHKPICKVICKLRGNLLATQTKQDLGLTCVIRPIVLKKPQKNNKVESIRQVNRIISKSKKDVLEILMIYPDYSWE